jgi:hypothetical protein
MRKAADLAADVASEIDERLEPIRQVLKQMAQPSSGPVGSRQAAVPPDSGDEGDDGSRISCAAVLAVARESIDCGSVPRFCCAD